MEIFIIAVCIIILIGLFLKSFAFYYLIHYFIKDESQISQTSSQDAQPDHEAQR